MSVQDVPTRILDLLADRALDGLDPSESLELDALLARHPEFDDDSMDLTASALLVADLAGDPGVREGLPQHLQESVRAAGERWVAHHAAGGPAALPRPRLEEPRSAPASTRAAPAARGPWSGLGWLAAAAAIAVAALAWWPSLTAARSPLAARQLLLGAGERGERLVRWDWKPMDHALVGEGASGDVVWCPGRQEGYLLIRGLAPNDPTVRQYQLWIFDQERDERYPVDGGVFDVPAAATGSDPASAGPSRRPATGEVVIPIKAKLPVGQPTLFAVTVEPPGGVVVSDRDIVLVAGP